MTSTDSSASTNTTDAAASSPSDASSPVDLPTTLADSLSFVLTMKKADGSAYMAHKFETRLDGALTRVDTLTVTNSAQKARIARLEERLEAQQANVLPGLLSGGLSTLLAGISGYLFNLSSAPPPSSGNNASPPSVPSWVGFAVLFAASAAFVVSGWYQLLRPKSKDASHE